MSELPHRPSAGMPLGNYQFEIYQQPAGKVSTVPFNGDELEQFAREKLSPGAFGYVAGGASSEDTMRANLAAFTQHRIVPRFLRDCAQRDWRINLLGTEMPAPVLLAPIGVLFIPKPKSPWPARRQSLA